MCYSGRSGGAAQTRAIKFQAALSALLCWGSLGAYGQSGTPTIGNITVNAVSHASVNIQFTNNQPSWVQLKYGLTSGNYIYTSASYRTSVNYSDNGNIDASISLGGLAPGTTYYVLPTARPDENDDANICAAPSCGAVEQVFTTQPLPAVHPVPPAPPVAWIPTEPDTSSYTVIPMQVSSSTGECVAAADVAQQPQWSGGVLAGDNIPTILGKIFFGTVIEFPQGATCKVFQTEPNWHSGYVLPALPIDPNAGGDIDSPNHRWIVFRTHAVTPADFPPFGVRTGPQWAPKLAKLVAQNPGEPTDGSAPGLGVQNFNGQLFDCYMQQCHHFWFENMEWSHLADTTIYPAGLVDPPAFVDYIRLIPSLSGSPTPATTPNYNVIDRIYAHGQPWPARELVVFAPGGDHWAVMSSWAQANMWIQGVYPQVNPVITGAVLSIPQSFYQENAFDNNPIGMTAPATATFTVPDSYSGVFYAWIDQTGLTIDYQTGTGVGMVCTGCTAKSEGSPARSSVPRTAMYFFNGHFSNGTAILDDSTLEDVTTSELPYFRPLGIYDYPGHFAFVDNNFISAIGQTVYNDTFGAQTDETWTHNYFYFPRSRMQHSGQWDGYGYSFRNVFESKQALRWNLEGNIFDGAAAYQNTGNVLYVAGSYVAPYSTGSQDIAIRNNIFKHISSGFQCAGAGAAGPPDSPVAARIEVSNNLFLDLNRDLYNDGGGGLFSGPFSSYPGCEDLNIHNNTVGLTLGTGPAPFLMGGESVMGEGLNYTNNEVHLSVGYTPVLYTVCGQVVASHPANPATVCPSGPTATNYIQMLNTSYMHQGPTITPSWNFTNNVFIGALTNYGLPAWTDITQGALDQIAANFPPGNIFPTGATMAAREAAVNWDPVTYQIVPSVWNPGNIGADVDAITSATGTVTNIVVTPAAASVQFAYTAPDTRACYVDVSPDGVSWTRTQDAGGAVNRSLSVGNLAQGSTYQYRLMCYFDQSAQYEFLANQITSGSFLTGRARRAPFRSVRAPQAPAAIMPVASPKSQ